MTNFLGSPILALAVACIFFVLGSRMNINAPNILNGVLIFGWLIATYAIYYHVPWLSNRPTIPQILTVGLVASSLGLVLYYLLWTGSPRFTFGSAHEMADPVNNGENVPEALSILGIPVVFEKGFLWSLPDTTVQVRFADPRDIGHDPTEYLRWDARGDEGRNGVAILRLHPGHRYLVRLVARYAHAEPPRGWYGVVLEENTLLNPKQENVKLPVGGSYVMRLEICAISKRFDSPWYVVHVPAIEEDNAEFKLTISERRDFEIQGDPSCR